MDEKHHLESGSEDALFIRKKGPPSGQGEAKEWTRGYYHCPKKNSYLGEAQQENNNKDDQELVKNQRRRKDDCFKCSKKGHPEGNVTITQEVILSGFLVTKSGMMR